MKGKNYLLRALPDDLNFALKMRALKEDCCVRDLILAAIRVYLKEPKVKK
jgi:hypothetical protein